MDGQKFSSQKKSARAHRFENANDAPPLHTPCPLLLATDPSKMTSRDEEDIKNGKLMIAFKEFNDKDFKRVLTKLSSDARRERRPPRKCQRLDGVNAILVMLPPPVPVHSLNFVGNSKIGDAGMAHIHLVPDSVSFRDFPSAVLPPWVSNCCVSFSRLIHRLLP